MTRYLVYCLFFFFVMIRRPPRSTRTDTLFPYTTLFRSQIALCERVIAIAGEPSIGHPLDLGLLLQPFGERERVGAMPLPPQVQRLHAGQRQEGVHRHHLRAELAHTPRAAAAVEGEMPERLGKYLACILGEGGGKKG